MTFARISANSSSEIRFGRSLRSKLLQVTDKGATTILETEADTPNIILLSTEGEVRGTVAATVVVVGGRMDQYLQEGRVDQTIAKVKAVEVTKDSTRGKGDEK